MIMIKMIMIRIIMIKITMIKIIMTKMIKMATIKMTKVTFRMKTMEVILKRILTIDLLHTSFSIVVTTMLSREYILPFPFPSNLFNSNQMR